MPKQQKTFSYICLPAHTCAYSACAIAQWHMLNRRTYEPGGRYMKRFFAVLALLILSVSGCASVKALPEQVENGIINAGDNSLAITNNNVKIKANVSETAINAYNLAETVTAFKLTINNNSTGEVAFADDSFVLVDEHGTQYSLLTP